MRFVIDCGEPWNLILYMGYFLICLAWFWFVGPKVPRMRFYREEVFDLHRANIFYQGPRGMGLKAIWWNIFKWIWTIKHTHTHTINQNQNLFFSTKVLLTCLDCQRSIRGSHWLTIKSKTPAYIRLNPLTSPYKHRRYKIRNGYPNIED